MEYILAPSILAADFKEPGGTDETDRGQWGKISSF